MSDSIVRQLAFVLHEILSSIESSSVDTTAIETLLQGIQNNAQINVVELQNVVSQLQSVDQNTDNVEALLATSSSTLDDIALTLGQNSSVIDVTPNPDQQHVEVQGLNTSVPSGLKSVVISNLTGVSTINGSFELGTGRRPDALSFNASESSRARGILPAYAIAGGTWQWIGLQPIAEA